MREFMARKDASGNYQTLQEHLERVGKLSRKFSLFPNISELAALLHDVGKCTDSFQVYLNEGGKRGSVIHAQQGAFLLNELFPDENGCGGVLKEVLSLVVFAHHTELKDGVTPDGEEVFFDKLKLKQDEKYHFAEVVEKLSQISPNIIQRMKELFERGKRELEGVIKKIAKNTELNHFFVGLIAKYIYSCLIDADRLDAYLFDCKEEYLEIGLNANELLKKLEKSCLAFQGKKDEISTARKIISDKCALAAERESGIYRLTVPTGGGKTLSSLRYALLHAEKFDKKRIIYVIPYLSIIEQTAEVFKKHLDIKDDSNILLEHHSSVVSPEDDEKRMLRKLAYSCWGNPIIVTTMVQFLETVMSAKGGELRKFHNMQDAVIIFDEIQSLPLHSINLFNEVISFLSTILGTTIILCSATQPPLQMSERKNLKLAENPALIEGATEVFSGIKRTKVIVEKRRKTAEFSDFVLEKGIEEGNCLAIVNTKKVAREVYASLKERAKNEGFQIFHLSTFMCGIHRKNVLSSVKSSLKKGEPVILISTQLVEAGVDISFACVVRAMAGLDSITQAAGRCNRSGEFGETKKVYAIAIEDEEIDGLVTIKIGKEVSERIAYENKTGDYLSPHLLQSYYNNFYGQQGISMDYEIMKKYNAHGLLSENSSGRGNYENRTGKRVAHVMTQAFKSVSDNYHVIAKDTKSVVVQYKEAKDLLVILKNSFSTKEKLDAIKKLERYSISLHTKEFADYFGRGEIAVFDEEFGIYLLNEGGYSEEFGLDSSSGGLLFA